MAGEKRSADEASAELHQESAILLDVEGTTSSISFVQDTLFPYIREFLKKHVDEKWSTDEFKADFAKLKEQAKEDEEKKVDGFVPIKEDTEDEAKETLIKNVLWQMDKDRKTGALKQLQGHMWKAAHKPIKGHVYDDVPKAFEEWTGMGKKLYIYSSGSVEAQKLLYGDSVHGDLLKYISGHFDTTVGPKQEADSYKKILKEINLEPSNVLFLTDVVKEAQAAKEAGLATTVVIREGNAKLTDEDKAAFKTIESFAELLFQSTSKRQKIDEDEESKKKDPPKEDAVVKETTNGEAMDTSEDATAAKEEKKVDKTTDVKAVESSVDKVVVEAEKKIETRESEKEVTPMEEDTKSEEKTDADAKTEVSENSIEDKSKTILSDQKIAVDGPEKKTTEGEKKATEVEKKSTEAEKKATEVEKKSTEAEKKATEVEKSTEVEKKATEVEKKSTEVEKKEVTDAGEKKTADVIKESEKVSDEKALNTEVPEKTENNTEKITEKVAEAVTDKIVDETAKDIEKEAKTDEKEVKENGESKVEQNNKPVDSKAEETENKENVQSENIEEKTESKTDNAEEVKETATVESSGDSEKTEKETEKSSSAESESVTEKSEVKALNGKSANGDMAKDVADDKIHTNGIKEKTEKTKETDEPEESIKVKKAVADGAGETDVVVPPVVAATS